MSTNDIQFSVFTKPWKNSSIEWVGEFVSGLGFDGIEFPLRDGFQLEPQNAELGLPKLTEKLKAYGLSIFSVASSTKENVFAGCAAAGVPMIRIMIDIGPNGYMATLEEERKKLESLLPLCEKYGVKIGVQQHYGDNLVDSMSLRYLLNGFDSKYISAIWDSAHDALAGQVPEYGLDTVWDHLGMVNFKNAYYYRQNGPEALNAVWERYFTTGRQGLASWPRAADYLKQRGYKGVICLTAEYDDVKSLDRLIAEDIVYAKSLFS
ncbi:sugar phosphate isomerase/epimerase family protein [Paenibacillus montanisoli]|uniref:Xylose isomerase-like TIM barrel domain-containing protein n=1 Tax=Paenibacillus montanisoli TaxID=2081970 RepID=A0A328UC91_9BACL|nr:TIM barrel protein [Paenibacillus montanisoli]RAP78545.1 hypothetical protein DL346_09035 [Paenibacillus montanisoli]